MKIMLNYFIPWYIENDYFINKNNICSYMITRDYISLVNRDIEKKFRVKSSEATY